MKGLLVAAAISALSANTYGDEDLRDRSFGVTRMLGATLGQPQGLSLSAGLIIGSVPAKPVKCAFSYWTDGLFLQAGPGTGGGKASVGLATSNGLFGMAIKGTVVRTWGKSWGTKAGVTYAGGELEFAAFTRFTAGWLWRVGGSQGKRSMFTWGVGLGF